MAAASNTVRPETLDVSFAGKQQGLWGQAYRRLIRNRLAAGAAIVLLAVIAMSLLTAYVPAIARYEPQATQYEEVRTGPTSDHWFGTDQLGRDQWSRVWEGMRNSLRIAFGTQFIVLAIGLLIGAGAALGGRFADNALMRLTDIAYAFPDLLAIILLRSIFNDRNWPIIGTGDPQIPGFSGDLLQIILAISLVSWVTIARLVRGQMLSLREKDYVLAARALGASTPRIVFSHMLPNTLGPVIVAVTFGIPLAIFAEAILGFIGLGLAPPTASLGSLINDGFNLYRANHWLITIPSLSVALLMLCFTFLGDGLRDALDPRTRR